MPFAEQRKIIEFFVARIDIIDHKNAVIHFQVPMDNRGVRLLADEGLRPKKKARQKLPGLKINGKNFPIESSMVGPRGLEPRTKGL